MVDKIPKFKYLNCITVTTDASFNHKRKVGGYAFIISYADKRKYGAGALIKSRSNSAEEAEVMCIVTGKQIGRAHV